MRWMWQILVDLGSLASFTVLIIYGHYFAAILPAVVLLTFQIRERKEK